ncbi:MAG: hypothetical protein ACOCYE_09525 [Pseudomonadota bacterium]
MDATLFLPALPALVLHTATLGALQAILYLVLRRALACGWPTGGPIAVLARLAVTVLTVHLVWLGLAIALERGTPPPPAVLWIGPVALVALVVGRGLLLRGSGWALALADPLVARRTGIATASHARQLGLVALLLVLLIAVLQAALPPAVALAAAALTPLVAVLLLGPVTAVVVAGSAVAADGLVGLALPETPPGLAGALVVSLPALLVGAVALWRDGQP